MARQPIKAPVFAPLLAFLIACPSDAVILSFAEIEALIGCPLSLGYRVDSNRWASTRYVHVQLWRSKGWRAHFSRRHRRSGD
jgi:hypothetical protein